MIFGLTVDDFSENQIKILKLLFERNYLQKELQEILKTTGANLHYHLSRMGKYNLIRKETLHQIGNAKINRISINPSARQFIRQILGFKIQDYTLITGFGTLKKGYQIPDSVFKILKEKYYPISRVVCFTSPDAIEKRKEHQKHEELMKIDRYIQYSYEEYRDFKSKFFKEIENIISVEMKTSDIIIDLTPLSKLFSFKLLELSNKYNLPCIYLGINKNGDSDLLSMSKMKIEWIIKKLN